MGTATALEIIHRMLWPREEGRDLALPQPNSQKWAKVEIIKRQNRGINNLTSYSELSPRNPGSAEPLGSQEGLAPLVGEDTKERATPSPLIIYTMINSRTSQSQNQNQNLSDIILILPNKKHPLRTIP